jgi:hypothetical protein
MSNGGNHADLIVQTPDGRTVLLDYGYSVTQSNTNPSGGMVQNSQLTGVGIRDTIFDGDGKPVGEIPSDLGVLLHQMTDQPVSDLDPLASGRANNVATGGKQLLKHIRIFASVGTTPTGNLAQGAGVSAHFDTREVVGRQNSAYLSLRGAAMLYQNDNTVADLLQSIRSRGYYANLHAEAGMPALTKTLSSGGQLSLRGKAVANFESQQAVSSTDSDIYRIADVKNLDNRFNFGAGVEARYCSADGNTFLNSEVMILGGVAAKSFTDATQGIGVYYEGVAYRVGGEHRISPSTSVVGNATVVQRTGGLGTEGRFTLGVLERYHGFRVAGMVGVEGPIGARAPAFVPGGQRRIDFDATVTDPSERYTLGVRTSCPVGTGLRTCYLGGIFDAKF